MKSKYILVIALVLAIVTTIMFGKYLKDLDRKYTSGKDLVQIVVLKQDIKRNQRITNELLEIKSYHAASVHPEAVKKIEDIQGSYTLVDMKAGEVLFLNRFTNQVKEKELLTRKIKEGYRAVSIEANYVESVSTMIEPEDQVDVMFSDAAGTQMLLENIRVLAVGKRIVAASDASAASQAAEGAAAADQGAYSALTLELTPEQIKTIVNADGRGNIKFVLRSKLEQK